MEETLKNELEIIVFEKYNQLQKIVMFYNNLIKGQKFPWSSEPCLKHSELPDIR